MIMLTIISDWVGLAVVAPILMGMCVVVDFVVDSAWFEPFLAF